MTNEIAKKLKAPAIGLIITGVINLIWGIVETISNLYFYLNHAGIYGQQQSQNYYIGVFLGAAIVVLSMILSPFVIFGGVQMLRVKGYNFSRVAAVLAILPFASCCFILGAPFGIWALFVLNSRETKAFYAGETTNQFNPPPNF